MFFLRPLGQFKHRFRLLLQDKQEMQSICNTCSTHHSMGWGTPATQAAQSVPLYSTPWSPGSASYTGATRRHLRKNTAQTLWDTKLEQPTKKKMESEFRNAWTLNSLVDMPLAGEVGGRFREERVEQLPQGDQLPLPQNLVAHLHHLPHCLKSKWERIKHTFFGWSWRWKISSFQKTE